MNRRILDCFKRDYKIGGGIPAKLKTGDLVFYEDTLLYFIKEKDNVFIFADPKLGGSERKITLLDLYKYGKY